VSVPTSVLPKLDDVTLSFTYWMEIQANNATLFSTGSSGSDCFLVQPRADGRGWAVVENVRNAGAYRVEPAAKNAVPAGRWVNVAYAHDSSSQKGRLYIDGVAVGEGDMPYKFSDMAPGSGEIRLGTSQWWNDQGLIGKLGDFKIFAKALSDKEISDEYLKLYASIYGIDDPSYGVSLDTEDYAFPAAVEGYLALPAKTFTATNSGNMLTGILSVGLGGDGADAFTASPAVIPNIAIGGAAGFTVKPKAGLSPGTYVAAVTVGGDNGIAASADVSFSVAPAPAPAHGVSLSQTEEYAFADSEPLTVTVTNIGNQPTGSLNVALAGDGAGHFALSSAALPGIPAGGAASFTVTPKAGALGGTYGATVAVSGGNGISASFSVKYSVEETPYALSLDRAGTHAFPSAGEGYGDAPARAVTVTNAGSQPSGELSVGLGGDGADAFRAYPPVLASLPPGASASFIVAPVAGLAAGTHAASVTVGNGNASAGFNVSFRVRGSGAAPLLRYDFKDIEGTAVRDITGNGYDGAITGSGITAVSDFDGGGVEFAGPHPSGAYKYIGIPTGILPELDDVTVTFTLNPSASSDWTTLFNAGWNGYNCFIVFDRAARAPLGLQALTNINGNDTSDVRVGAGNGASLALNKWTNVAYAYDSEEQAARLYVDGALVGEKTGVAYKLSSLAGAGSDIRLGSGRFWTDPGFVGKMGDFRIYSRALGRQEIQDEYEKAFRYGVKLSEWAYAFPPAAQDYASVEPRSVTAANTGNQPTGELAVSLGGRNPAAFTVSAPNLGSVAVGGSAGFGVAPGSGLAPGTYEAVVTVSGGNGISDSFALSFEVKEKPAPGAPDTDALKIALEAAQSIDRTLPYAQEGIDALNAAIAAAEETLADAGATQDGADAALAALEAALGGLSLPTFARIEALAGGGAKASYHVSNAGSDQPLAALCVVAAYTGGGALKSVESRAVRVEAGETATAEIEAPAAGGTVRAFVWNADTYAPLCEAAAAPGP
jgi:hypothetical protein